MKNIITLFLITGLSYHAFAVENYFPVGKSGANTTYTNKAKCAQAEGQECFDISTKDPRFHEVQTAMVDDTSKPIYKAKYNLTNCDSEPDCLSKYDAKNASCSNGDYAQHEKNTLVPGFSVYCIGIASYEQKEVKTLVVNSDLKTSIEAADAEKAAMEASIATMQKHVAFGNRMIAYIGARNISKGLTTVQVKSVVETYGTIQSLLGSGSLVTAKSEIEAITPDGTLITQADKDALLAEINSYLGL